MVEGVSATKETLTTALDLTADYSGDPMTVDFNGTTYTVDAATLANLDGTTETNITPDLKQELKMEIVSALRSAKNGTDSLSQVADVYFNENDQLVIKSRTYGDLASDITLSAGGTAYNAVVDGADTTEALITGTENLSSTDITTAVTDGAGVEKVLINLNGEQREITVDMQALATNDVAGYVAAMQASVDAEFGAGVITVGGTDGNPITFETVGTVDGKTPRLSVQPIQAHRSELLTDFDDMIAALNTGDDAGIQNFLGKLDVQMDNLMAIWGDVGARTNRLELITERINETQVNITSLLSDAEDVDMAEAIMYLKNAENVYRASLSAGARIIQPTLMDFLR
jgi:flagellin-like hook-associated protein FlgL